MKNGPAPIPFAGSQLDRVRHVCAFFNSEEEEYRVLLPFIQGGFDCGDKAVHVVSPGRHEAHLDRLASIGIDTVDAQRRGQLELKSNIQAYLRDGRFDQDRMLETFAEMAEASATGPYPLSRIVCQMDWASGNSTHIHELVEFEARVNDIWSRLNDAVICVYDLAKFGGETVIDMMRTHPMIIIGGILQENPFYVPPHEFLGEFRRRNPDRRQDGA